MKDVDAVRCFALWEPNSVEAEMDDDDEQESNFPDEILDVINEELYIYFQYNKYKKSTKQAALLESAEKTVLDTLVAKGLLSKFPLTDKAPTENDRKRTVLRKYLDQYAAKNTSDYFIHKDLKGFLTRELDFYIKNEMMHLDNIQDAKTFRQIEMSLRQIQAVRLIASELICFMAQLEDFQKKLWLKKKFIVQCDYCITMDRLSKNLQKKALANKEQLNYWEKLGLELSAIAEDSLDARMVDTQFFDEQFKSDLLREISDIDEQCDGVLIKSNNIHGINILKQKYTGKIKCIYIDPPYNTDGTPIIYKNGYRHSSWLSLMSDRIEISKYLLNNSGVFIVAIDKYEVNRLYFILEECFRNYEIDPITIIHNPRGITGDNFSYTHEYAFFVSPKIKNIIKKCKISSENIEYSPLRNWGWESLRSDAKNCFYPIIVKDNAIIEFGDICEDDFHPEKNIKNGDKIYIYPIDKNNIERKWRYARQTVESIKHLLRIKKDKKGIYDIEIGKDFGVYKTVWNDSKFDASSNGSQLLTQLQFETKFDFPKSIHTVKECLYAVVSEDSHALIFDYFAGSGTTAHATIALNRDDGGSRKYILVEMGEHFDTVIKPRIQKIVYSPDWKDGAPQAHDKGISHCFKYFNLESYEDAINNIALSNNGKNIPELIKDEYLLKYMLDVESRGSIINTDSFKKPFDYTLKIAVDSSGATQKKKIDLVETFNYLIGLNVIGMDRNIDKGYVFVEGTMPNGDLALVVWRDVEKVNNDQLNKLLEKRAINPGNTEFKVLFVNGDHEIPNRKLGDEEAQPEMKIKQLENVFLEKMFEDA